MVRTALRHKCPKPDLGILGGARNEQIMSNSGISPHPRHGITGITLGNLIICVLCCALLDRLLPLQNRVRTYHDSLGQQDGKCL